MCFYPRATEGVAEVVRVVRYEGLVHMILLAIGTNLDSDDVRLDGGAC